jgi:hypothetical protein
MGVVNKGRGEGLVCTQVRMMKSAGDTCPYIYCKNWESPWWHFILASAQCFSGERTIKVGPKFNVLSAHLLELTPVLLLPHQMSIRTIFLLHTNSKSTSRPNVIRKYILLKRTLPNLMYDPLDACKHYKLLTTSFTA